MIEVVFLGGKAVYLLNATSQTLQKIVPLITALGVLSVRTLLERLPLGFFIRDVIITLTHVLQIHVLWLVTC